MKNNLSLVESRSRNENNTTNVPDRELEGSSLLNTLNQIVGEPNHENGYSSDKLANFFRKNSDFAKFVISSNETDKIQVNKLFERVADCLDFNVYLQRKVATHLKGKFTADQLHCIFQAFNGIWIQYDGNLETHIKETLYDYINHEGSTMFDIGDVNVFKNTIENLNPFEFEIFVNLILEIWGIEENMFNRMQNFLVRG